MFQLTADIKFALRRWTRRPLFPVAAASILALSIGATTAMLTVASHVLFPRLPWPEANRLVLVHAVLPTLSNNPTFSTYWSRAPVSWATWRDLRKTPEFENVAVWEPTQQLLGRNADLVQVFYTSSSFPSILGLKPHLGRLFTPEEDDAGSDAMIVSYEAWQARFGGNPDILTQVTLLAGSFESAPVLKRIIGVLSPGFRFQGESPEFLLPMGLRSFIGSFDTSYFLHTIGRLARGVSRARAESVAEPLVRRSDSPDRRTARVVTLAEDRFGAASRPVWVMLAGTGLLLLIACSNVAGLVLIEAASRRREVTIRLALGASRRAIVGQLVTEHALLALAACGGGLALAYWLTPVLLAVGPIPLTSSEIARLDFRVIASCVLLGTATIMLAGLAPMARMLNVRAAGLLRDDRGIHGRGLRGHRFLVAAQLALALVLLVSATLFAGTVLELRSRPLGFDPTAVSVASLRLTRPPALPARYRAEFNPKLDLRAPMMEQLMQGWTDTALMLDRIASLPGVVAVAGASGVPFVQEPGSVGVRAAGSDETANVTVPRYMVSETFFDAMGIRMDKGRPFNRSDRQGPRVAIVSLELQRRLFNGDALGKKMTQDTVTYDIVGVAPNVRQRQISDDDHAAFYVLDMTGRSTTQIIVRATDNDGRILPSVKKAITEHDPSLVVTRTVTLDAVIAASFADERFRATLATVFGGTALALATVSLFGVMSRLVSERRREIGIRMAIGASPGQVRDLVLRDALVIVGAGIAAGVPAALGMSHLSESLFFGVSATHGGMLGLALVLLTVATASAAATAAFRAGRIEPLTVLRE